MGFSVFYNQYLKLQDIVDNKFLFFQLENWILFDLIFNVKEAIAF